MENKVLENLFLSIFRGHRGDHPTGKLSVSGMTFPCERHAYYELTVPKGFRGISTYGVIKTWTGSKLHETMVFPTALTELSLEWNDISGHPDEYVKEEAYLLEKKISEYIPRNEARENHKKQVNFYRVLLEKNGYPVAKAGVLYMDPHTTKMKVYPVRLEPVDTVVTEMTEIRNRLFNAVKYGIVPPRNVVPWEEGGLSLTCSYCGFCGLCFKE